jgi:hypothetical protein
MNHASSKPFIRLDSLSLFNLPPLAGGGAERTAVLPATGLAELVPIVCEECISFGSIYRFLLGDCRRLQRELPLLRPQCIS